LYARSRPDHVQLPSHLQRSEIYGKPQSIDATEGTMLGQAIPRAEHHVLAVGVRHGEAA